MRYTVVIISKESYEYRQMSSDTYNFNPEYNKLTRAPGRPKSWMVDLVKQKDGVYLVKQQRSADEPAALPQPETQSYLLIPESHPFFNAVCIDYIDLESVYLGKISAFLKKVSEGIVRELLNN